MVTMPSVAVASAGNARFVTSVRNFDLLNNNASTQRARCVTKSLDRDARPITQPSIGSRIKHFFQNSIRKSFKSAGTAASATSAPNTPDLKSSSSLSLSLPQREVLSLPVPYLEFAEEPSRIPRPVTTHHSFREPATPSDSPQTPVKAHGSVSSLSDSNTNTTSISVPSTIRSTRSNSSHSSITKTCSSQKNSPVIHVTSSQRSSPSRKSNASSSKSICSQKSASSHQRSLSATSSRHSPSGASSPSQNSVNQPSGLNSPVSPTVRQPPTGKSAPNSPNSETSWRRAVSPSHSNMKQVPHDRPSSPLVLQRVSGNSHLPTPKKVWHPPSFAKPIPGMTADECTPPLPPKQHAHKNEVSTAKPEPPPVPPKAKNLWNKSPPSKVESPPVRKAPPIPKRSMPPSNNNVASHSPLVGGKRSPSSVPKNVCQKTSGQKQIVSKSNPASPAQSPVVPQRTTSLPLSSSPPSKNKNSSPKIKKLIRRLSGKDNSTKSSKNTPDSAKEGSSKSTKSLKLKLLPKSNKNKKSLEARKAKGKSKKAE